jgi:hypothetical protein
MTLDENDYLTFQLYNASRTPRIKSARTRSQVITTVTFLLLALLFYQSKNEALTIYFLILAGLALALFPLYTRWRYKQHYTRHIRDTYKQRFGEPCQLEFTPGAINTKDKTGEVSINKSEIEEINEIKGHYFFKTRSGTTLIIAKTKAEDLSKIRNEIALLVETNGVKHNIDLDWKWR